MGNGTDERAPVLGGVVISDILDREEELRQAVRERDEKLNLPSGDVPRGADRVDEREVTRYGGIQRYLEYELGGPDYAAKPGFDEREFLKGQWEEHMGDQECPDFEDPVDGVLNMDFARAALDRNVFGILQEGERETEMTHFYVEGKGEPVDVSVNLTGVENRDLRMALERVGGEKYIQEIMRTAVRMRLMAPRSENHTWTIKLEGPNDRFLMASLKDFARMFVVSEENEKKPIELPDPGDGTSTADLKDLVLAIHRLRLNGDSLQKHVGLEVESLG